MIFYNSQTDPQLEMYRTELIMSVAKKLDQARMIRFVEHTGGLHATDLGRTASHFYIKYASIEVNCIAVVLVRFMGIKIRA